MSTYYLFEQPQKSQFGPNSKQKSCEIPDWVCIEISLKLNHLSNVGHGNPLKANMTLVPEVNWTNTVLTTLEPSDQT